MTLGNQYHKAMGKLRVTPEMRERVLSGALAAVQLQAGREQEHPRHHLRRYLPVAAAACLCLVVLSMALPQRGLPVTNDPVQIVSPIQQAEGLEDLKSKTPFPLKAPARLPDGYVLENASLIAGTVAQVRYAGPGGAVTYRMAEGSSDVSGDYNQYTESVTERVGGLDMTLKGDGDTVSLVLWTDGTYSFSLSFSSPVPAEVAASVAESVSEL